MSPPVDVTRPRSPIDLAVVEVVMLVLFIVLLAAWVIVSVVGFAVEGLMWIGIIGVVLFVGTAAIGAVRRKALHR